MNKTNLFKLFKYVVGNSFTYKNKRGVKVFFIYKERINIILPLKIKKIKSREDKQYYIDEAEKIIAKMIKDGSLEKYSEKYIKEKKKKRLLAIFIPLVSACALAGAGVGIYYALNQPIAPNKYEVSCSTSDVSIANPEAKVGIDYQATLNVKKEKIDEFYAFPSTLDSVTSNGEVITNYTYTPNHFTATLFIPKESIKGDIVISLNLKKLTELCLTAQEDNSTIAYIIDGELPHDIDIETSTNGSTWMNWDGTEITLNNGEFRYIRNTKDVLSTKLEDDTNVCVSFVMTGKIAASGNVQSMINNADLSPYCFDYLFFDCSALITAPALPATTLASGCYHGMFSYCSSLTQSPPLPATTLVDSCYYAMFRGCTHLTQAPALPATTLASGCYYSMFSYCSSLTQAPALPATTLADSCYHEMFFDCSSLTQAPALPATTLADSCYYSMFQRCSSLTQAPALPAATLKERCYEHMFYGCDSLVNAPELHATTLADYCYSFMFSGCKSLTKAPELPAKTLAIYCYSQMFMACSSLTKNPELPATTLADSCYFRMFQGCSSLTQAPALPATTLANSCYSEMFSYCSSLKVNENGTGTKIFTCPVTTGLTRPVTNMFDNISPDATFSEGTPTAGNTYNWYN